MKLWTVLASAPSALSHPSVRRFLRASRVVVAYTSWGFGFLAFGLSLHLWYTNEGLREQNQELKLELQNATILYRIDRANLDKVIQDNNVILQKFQSDSLERHNYIKSDISSLSDTLLNTTERVRAIEERLDRRRAR